MSSGDAGAQAGHDGRHPSLAVGHGGRHPSARTVQEVLALVVVSTLLVVVGAAGAVVAFARHLRGRGRQRALRAYLAGLPGRELRRLRRQVARGRVAAEAQREVVDAVAESMAFQGDLALSQLSVLFVLTGVLLAQAGQGAAGIVVGVGLLLAVPLAAVAAALLARQALAGRRHLRALVEHPREHDPQR